MTQEKKQKTKARGNGEGSIYKRTDGKWVASVTVGRNPITGQLKRKDLYGKTREEVKNKLTDVLKQVKEGTFTEPSKVTVSQWMDRWLETYKKNEVRPTTFGSYEYLIRVHINASIGHMMLKDLLPMHIQQMYNEKLKTDSNINGLSSRTIRYIHVLLNEALEQAVNENMIAKNACKIVKPPKQQKKEAKVMTVEQETTFLNALNGERLSAAFILSLASGVRVGELLALRWQDTDMEEGVIRIRQAISRVRIFDEDSEIKSKLIFQEPKTKAGKRSIPIPKNVLKDLKQHKIRQSVEKFKAGSSYEDIDLIFSTELGRPIESRNFTRTFHSILKRAGLEKINLHALRHTFATRLLEEDVSAKVAQEFLGHSTISMTLDTYTHVMPERKQDAADKLNHIFERKIPSVKEGTH